MCIGHKTYMRLTSNMSMIQCMPVHVRGVQLVLEVLDNSSQLRDQFRLVVVLPYVNSIRIICPTEDAEDVQGGQPRKRD